MTSAAKTANYHLSQFGDTDKPTWRGDYTADMAAIDAALEAIQAEINANDTAITTINGEITSLNNELDLIETGYYNVLDDPYSAVGDGTTDDTTAINSAINDCYNAGGGFVVVPSTHNFAFAGQIIVKNGVWLTGYVSNDGASKVTLTATSTIGASQIMVGSWLASPIQNYAGGLANIVVNGNSKGPTGATNTGLICVQSVHFGIKNVMVKSAAGVNIAFDACQNGVITELISEGAGSTGISLTNGSGGLTFSGCHSASNTLNQIIFTDDAGGNAYTAGPQQNSFLGCIFETNVNCKNVAEFDYGLYNHFYNCLFSANNSVTLSDGCVVRNTAALIGSGIGMNVDFHDCQFVGSTNKYDLIRAGSGCGINVWGDTSIAYSTNFLVADGGSPQLGNWGTLVYGAGFVNTTATHVYAAINGGALTNVGNNISAMWNFLTEANWPYVMAGRRRGDVGQRFLVNQDGTWAWGNGTGAASSPNLSGDTTYNAVLVSALRNSGPKIDDVYVNPTVSAAGTTVTIDCTKGNKQQIFISAAGTITSMVFSNPVVNGQSLTIMMSQTGGRSYVWPTNCRFAGGSAGSSTVGAVTDTTANCFSTVTFHYYQAGNLWIETERAVAVPYT